MEENIDMRASSRRVAYLDDSSFTRGLQACQSWRALTLSVFQKFQECSMYALVCRKLRMKSCRHVFPLTHKNWFIADLRQHFNTCAQLLDLRRPNKHHLQWTAR